MSKPLNRNLIKKDLPDQNLNDKNLMGSLSVKPLHKTNLKKPSSIMSDEIKKKVK
jgi:hypothetical protein